MSSNPSGPDPDEIDDLPRIPVDLRQPPHVLLHMPQNVRSVALGNVRDRLRLLHDMQAQFQTALVDGRYQVRMEVPA